MIPEQTRSPWAPRIGWSVVLLLFVVFVLGVVGRTKGEGLLGEGAGAATADIRMLFVPSVEQGTLARRSGEMARFIYEDSGLTIRTEVPASYAAVVELLGAGKADIAWIPAFAYVLANSRYGVEARLQVVRTVDRYGIVVVRTGDEAGSPVPERRGVAIPRDLPEALRDRMVEWLEETWPGWREVPALGDRDAVRMLLVRPGEVSAAVSTHVYSGPNDLVGDGRKELEYEWPGSLERTRILHTTGKPAKERATVYYGCVMARTDSGIRRVEDLNGRRYSFADETSTSGHIFPRLLLERSGVALARDFFAGGHPNSVQAVWDGKADGGSAFYSPPGERQARDGTLVGDARALLFSRIPGKEERKRFLGEVRVIKLTDPIPNDVCAVRRGFSEEKWERFEASLRRFLETEEGKQAYFDLVAGVDAARTSDAAFDGFREALSTSGLSAEALLDEKDEKVKARKKKPGGDR